MGITRADPPPRLLDLTRLVSRVGRVMTGVDRVEYAYLRHLLGTGPLFGLVRSSLGYLLLDRQGCAGFLHRLDSAGFPPPGLQARLRRIPEGRAGAERALRRVAVARCLPVGLGRMLRRHLPAGIHYLNTGHSNLSARVLSAVGALPGARIGVLLHDTIPLDFPQFQVEGSPERFRALLERVGRHADLVICNSRQTELSVMAHLSRMIGEVPETVVAPLGVPRPVPTQAPAGPWTGAPYFVALGTIEPRKNHALLVDLWEEAGAARPRAPAEYLQKDEDGGSGGPGGAHLLICGARGWRNEALFARLDRGVAGVHELPGLDDGQIAALLQGSAGLLYPSLAEGFGLPAVEAAALGVPVLANDLEITREILGNIPVYAKSGDRYLWREEITRMAGVHRAGPGRRLRGAEGWEPPGWDGHFKTVLTLI